MQLSVIGKCPLFKKTRILSSADAQIHDLVKISLLL